MSHGDESAFPWVIQHPSGDHNWATGLTKRELVAMAAMQGVLAAPDCPPSNERIAAFAVRCADALLAELDKPAKSAETPKQEAGA